MPEPDHLAAAVQPGAEEAPVADPASSLAALEQQMADAWQRPRASTRRLAVAVHPRLDPTAYPLVAALRRAGALRPSELLHLDRPAVTRQIDAAEQLGLVTRKPDSDDARARPVSLTEQGRQRVEAVHSAQQERWRRALADWSHHDVQELARLVRKPGQADLGWNG